MPDPISSGPSGWWGIALGILSFLLAGYREWANRQRWKVEDERRNLIEAKAKKPKLTLTYIKAEKTGQFEYTLPGFEIKNIGEVPITNFKIDFVFEPNCPEQSRKQIKERINIPTRLDSGTNFQEKIFLGPGGTINLTLVINADSMDEIKWTHKFVRG
jgi:hypothetical protein